jgi:hypothetical protein
MTRNNRAASYAFSTHNLVGMACALPVAAVGALGFLTVPFGAAAAVLAYAVGAVGVYAATGRGVDLSPPPLLVLGQAERDVPMACEVVRAHLASRHGASVPAECKEKVEAILSHVATLHANAQGLSPEQSFDYQAIAAQYLPDTLTAFSQITFQRAVDRQKLEHALDVMLAKLVAIKETQSEMQSSKLHEQGSFLRARFGNKLDPTAAKLSEPPSHAAQGKPQ